MVIKNKDELEQVTLNNGTNTQNANGNASNETQNTGTANSNPNTATQSQNDNNAEAPALSNANTSAYKPSNPYNPDTDANYQRALSALQNAEKGAPQYTNSYADQIQSIYDKIVNRDKFTYDINADMLYQQYKDQYVSLGQMAMKDTMGQAAALTGGYGSSYGQAVGQQQYDAYLQQLTDKIPELYGMALDQYKQEGQDLKDIYALTGDMADDEYAKYMDAYNQWVNNRAYAAQGEDTAYGRGYQQYMDAYNMGQTDRQSILSLVTNTGYVPTDDELSLLGMTREQVNIILKNWYKQNGLPVPESVEPAKASSGGGGKYMGTSTPSGSNIVSMYEIADDIKNGASVNAVMKAIADSGATVVNAYGQTMTNAQVSNAASGVSNYQNIKYTDSFNRSGR